MITNLTIRRFKPFLDNSINLRQLTFILGENGAGKSSITQSILLTKQTFNEKDKSNLKLNGSLVKIGNGIDALSQSADEDSIELEFMFEHGQKISIKANYVQDSDILPMTVGEGSEYDAIGNLNVVFLSAERVGPQLLSSFSTSDAATKRVSERGENALAILHANQTSTLERSDPRVTEEMDSLSLKSAFDFYLSKISTGASIDVTSLSNVDSVASTFSFSKSGTLPTENIRPTNVGFGLSYSASIIVACLLAEQGDLLIIENPEAHLHTKGQRALGELFIRTAQSGVQIICETHSRDFLYSTRKKILAGEISSDLCNCNFVHRNERGSNVSEWYPLSKRFNELGQEFEGFLEFFGSPMDYMQG